MENGQIKISKDVICIIADLAISDTVDPEKVTRKLRNKGITITYEGEELILGIDLIVKYGVKIPAIAESVQKKVKASVENMTGLAVKAVNINIIGMNFEKSEE